MEYFEINRKSPSRVIFAQVTYTKPIRGAIFEQTESFEFLNADFPAIKTSAISALDFNRHHRQPTLSGLQPGTKLAMGLRGDHAIVKLFACV